MSRRKRLLNHCERAARDLVRDAASRFGAEVFSKVRLADVLDINQSGLSHDEFNYALKSHLDFVVTRNDIAEFALEFDGPHHTYDECAISNDLAKQSICRQLNLPLLRVDAQFLRPLEKFSVLTWLVTMWFANAQNENCLFDYMGFFENSSSDTIDPFQASRRFVCVKLMGSSPQKVEFYRGRDRFGYALAVAIYRVDNQRAIIGRGRCQTSLDWPVNSEFVAADLAFLDLRDHLELWIHGENRVLERDMANTLAREFQQWSENGTFVCPSSFVSRSEFIVDLWLNHPYAS
jgi:hypothetical protein